MSFVGHLHEGDMLVRLIPLHSPQIEIVTPRLLPPRFESLEWRRPTVVETDRWTWSGRESEGWMTAELWERTFGIAPPDDLDRGRMLVPVVWLDYRRRS